MGEKITEESIVNWCTEYVCSVLDISDSEVNANSEFDRFGLDSALTTAMIIDLEELLGIDISPSILFKQTTIKNIAAEISKQLN
jgi:acyl carrier protein